MPATLHIPPSRWVPRLGAFAILLLLVQVNTVFAQDGDDTPILPDLAPREVEIRGELQIQFPLLERQPLIGFNPPPQIPVLPAGRRPLVEEYKQRRADLPQGTIERPDAPTALQSSSQVLSGELEAAAGSYFDRLVRARFATAIAPRTTLTTALDYAGSDGSKVVPGSDVRNPFDSMQGELGVDHVGERVHALGQVSAFGDFYSLYGDDALTTSPVPGFVNGPDRDGRGVALRAQVGTPANRPSTVKAGATWSVAQFETVFADTTKPLERRLDASVSSSLPVGTVAVSFEAAAGSGGPLRAVGSARQYVQGLVGASYGMGGSFSGGLGVRVPGTRYDTQLTSTSGTQRELLYLSPDVHATLQVGRHVSIYAKNQPGVDINALSDVFRRSPFVVADPEIGPTLNVVDARAGLTVTYASLTFRPFGGYRWSPNLLYFSSGSGQQSVGTPPVVSRTGRARTILGGAELAVGVTGALSTAVSFEYREALLTELDVPVPYYPTLVGQGSVTFRFAKNRALFRLQARMEDGRTVDEAETASLDGIVSVDALASFDVTPNIGFTLRGLNLTGDGLEEWNRYRRTGRQVVGGVRIRW